MKRVLVNLDEHWVANFCLVSQGKIYCGGRRGKRGAGEWPAGGTRRKRGEEET